MFDAQCFDTLSSVVLFHLPLVWHSGERQNLTNSFALIMTRIQVRRKTISGFDMETFDESCVILISWPNRVNVIKLCGMEKK